MVKSESSSVGEDGEDYTGFDDEMLANVQEAEQDLKRYFFVLLIHAKVPQSVYIYQLQFSFVTLRTKSKTRSYYLNLLR